MPSLKRLHAQGGSISHGQPNNEEGEEGGGRRKKEKGLLVETEEGGF